MNAARIVKATSGYLWRLPLCAVTYAGGAAAGGALLSALGLPLPEVPAQANPRIMGLLLLVASLILAGVLVPLARRLGGPFCARWLTLALLCYLCLGVAAPLEGAIFTSLGGMAALPLFGMMQSYWLAPTLQVLHNTEMLADSLVYALALAVLLVRPGATKADELFTRFLLCLEQTPVGN